MSSLWWPTNHLALDLILCLALVAQDVSWAFKSNGLYLFSYLSLLTNKKNLSLQIRCRIYPVYSTLWFVMAGVEYYADTVWHCKSTASSLLPLSNVFKMYFSHVPSALSSLNIEIMNAVERQCHYYFRSPKSLFLFLSVPIFLEVSPPPRVFPMFSLHLWLCPLKAESHHPLWFDFLVFPHLS